MVVRLEEAALGTKQGRSAVVYKSGNSLNIAFCFTCIHFFSIANDSTCPVLSLECACRCHADFIAFAPSISERPVTHHTTRHKNNPARRADRRQYPDITSRLPSYIFPPARENKTLQHHPAPSYHPFHPELQQPSTKTCDTSPRPRISAPSCPTSATTVPPATSRPDPVSAILSSARSATAGDISISFVRIVSRSRRETIDTGVSIA